MDGCGFLGAKLVLDVFFFGGGGGQIRKKTTTWYPKQPSFNGLMKQPFLCNDLESSNWNNHKKTGCLEFQAKIYQTMQQATSKNIERKKHQDHKQGNEKNALIMFNSSSSLNFGADPISYEIMGETDPIPVFTERFHNTYIRISLEGTIGRPWKLVTMLVSWLITYLRGYTGDIIHLLSTSRTSQ